MHCSTEGGGSNIWSHFKTVNKCQQLWTDHSYSCDQEPRHTNSQPVTGCVGNHPHSSGNRWKHRQAHRPVNGFMGAVISLLTHGTTWQIPLMDLKFILTHMHTQFYMFGSAAQWEHSYAFTQSTESADTQKSTSLSKYTINVLINNIMWHVTTPFSHLHCINLSGSVTPGLQFYFKKSAWMINF